MANARWLLNRLKAMSPAEIKWRMSQKALQKQEESRFKQKQGVCETVFNPRLATLKFDAATLHLNTTNEHFSLNEDIDLLGFDYSQYKNDWHAGFQTENNWPLVFSYDLDYKQRDDIGDARTNWELSRHFQFTLLAKNYCATKKQSYLDELERQFNEWNAQNPFLYGISWTSTMEFAIRAINWIYTLAFIDKSSATELKQKLAIGTINMVDYVTKHRSRYSSANNHLLVEAAVIGIAGFAFRQKSWKDEAVSILTEEMPKQYYSDGVNRELSLHYQIFSMEAYALVLNLLEKNDGDIPTSWRESLKKQCQFVSDCRGRFGETIVFGDDDEGKIIDLEGEKTDRYAYVLQLFSCLLDERFDPFERVNETIYWLFDDSEIRRAEEKPLYDNSNSICYSEGGNTILKSVDGRILIGIDHAALGFGSIAAHGHADALSFQMFIDGKPLFVDPGTYIYHCDLSARNKLRKTSMHNTVCVDGRDQSEMLGAFLWGKKANCKLDRLEQLPDGSIELIASHDGYAPVIHKRTFHFDGHNTLEISDRLEELSNQSEVKLSFLLNQNWEVVQGIEDITVLQERYCVRLKFSSHDKFDLNFVNEQISPSFGVLEYATHLELVVRAKSSIIDLKTIVSIEELPLEY